MKQYNARIAVAADLPQIAELVPLAAIDMGEGHLIDTEHYPIHAALKLAMGVCFVVEDDGEIIGAITTNPIDVGHRMAFEAVEASHAYVRSDRRNYKAIAALYDAVEDYADGNGLKIFWHRLNYPEALRGEPSQSDRVDKLYKFRKYKLVGEFYVRYPASEIGGKSPYVRCGSTYLYEPGMRARRRGSPANVRRAPGPTAAPSEGDDDDGS